MGDGGSKGGARTASASPSRPVTTFVVERYWPGVSPEMLAEAVARAGGCPSEMGCEGRAVRYVRATLLPNDETVFCLFEAESVEHVAELNERASIPYDRIVGAVSLTPDGVGRT